ncbi:hypothetical protein M9H77_09113 [Catharanthus roseus]|uniref:Uncharacterized protein n=1 Tax=Catharanthus roseus TaxID=4058 RepID=A0ACC0C056_CATRO|nr:hypothetical protein M9H77_09113 [Catharanthus roseus]
MVTLDTLAETYCIPNSGSKVAKKENILNEKGYNDLAFKREKELEDVEEKKNEQEFLGKRIKRTVKRNLGSQRLEKDAKEESEKEVEEDEKEKEEYERERKEKQVDDLGQSFYDFGEKLKVICGKKSNEKKEVPSPTTEAPYGNKDGNDISSNIYESTNYGIPHLSPSEALFDYYMDVIFTLFASACNHHLPPLSNYSLINILLVLCLSQPKNMLSSQELVVSIAANLNPH